MVVSVNAIAVNRFAKSQDICAGQQCRWLHCGNEPNSHRHWIIGGARRRSLEAAVGSATFQAAWRFRHRSAGIQILFPAHDHDCRQPDRLDRALAVSALAPLLHVAEQQTRGEKEKRRERGGQERERSHFEYPRVSCGPALLPSALGRLFLIEGASVIADIPLRQLASRDDAPKPRLLTVFFPDTHERPEVSGGSCLLARLGARLSQLGGAFLAADLYGFAADLHFDGRLGVEGIIAGRARLLRHGSFSSSPAYRARSGDHSGASGAVEIFSQMGALPDQVLARNSAGVTP